MLYFLNKILSCRRDPRILKKSLVDDIISDPNFPFLVSFPRTGSHWLRMIMELYFGKPALARAFYYPKAREFTCYHTHDLDLTIKRANVVYLYRNPAETIYSQMSYHKQDIDNKILIKYWANIYGLHLEKWLVKENFTKKKTVITYEGMRDNSRQEFKKVCDYFNVSFDGDKLDDIKKQVSRRETKKKTRHDEQVVDLSGSYTEKKKYFTEKYSSLVFNSVYSQNPDLDKFFK